jgi:Ca-activated chloride channel family protein
MTKKQDFYSVLGITRNASSDEIRKSYFEAARHLHPDKNLAPGETEIFLDIKEAYEVLSNPKKRSKYDATLPPEKELVGQINQKIILSRESFLALDEPQLVYCILEFSVPPKLDAQPEPPLNLCLVLDRSTSMQGINMDVVKAAAIQIIRKLKPQDYFSVVAFNDRAETIIPATCGLDLAKEEARVQMLQPSGGTEIFSGLELGYTESLRNINHSKVNHIILITDGRTYGDEDQCKHLAQEAAGHGIGISSLGVGAEWNDILLDQLASITGGSSKYISRAQDIQNALLDKFNRFGKTYAEETRLDFEPLKGIELRYAFRLQPEVGPLSIESPMTMGPILCENSLKVLLEFIVQPVIVRETTSTFFKGYLSLSLMNSSTSIKATSLNLSCPVTNETNLEPPPGEIMDALSQLRLYRLQEQARLEINAGEYDQAAEHLTRLATHLLAQGERVLAKTVLIEVENIQKKKSVSKQGGKEIKYGTRALLNSGKSEKKS